MHAKSLQWEKLMLYQNAHTTTSRNAHLFQLVADSTGNQKHAMFSCSFPGPGWGVRLRQAG